MDIFTIISLLGGLAMFLYGMSLLSSGLEKVSGGHLEKTLEKLSGNVFKGVLLGAVVTAAIQSSSATTVIVVGLVNAKIMKLKQAIGVIMGANIGTTVTAHILRLADISGGGFFLRLMKPDTLAPLAIIIGVLLYSGCKRAKKREIGHVLIGFGILFTGMLAMSDAVRHLRDLPEFTKMFSSFENPIIGVLFGAIVTAIIQSSSASVGILQAIASTGQITFAGAFPVIMGQNIGTCMTPILASIGATKGAKRAALVHFSFNFLGTVVFLMATYSLQAVIGLPFWSDPISSGGIANFHTLFNVTITLMFLPFTSLLEKIAYKVFKPDHKSRLDGVDSTALSLDARFMVSPGLAINHARKIVKQMAYLSQENYRDSVKLFNNYDLKLVEKIKDKENIIDKMEDKLKVYLIQVSQQQLTREQSIRVSQLLQLESEYERVGDYSINIVECAQALYEDKATFSQNAMAELKVMTDAVDEIIVQSINAFINTSTEACRGIEPLEEIVDNIEEILKERHIERLKQNACTIAAGFPFVELLSNLERIADHCSNVGMSVVLNSEQATAEKMDPHEYRRRLHLGMTDYYGDLYAIFKEKYLNKIENSFIN